MKKQEIISVLSDLHKITGFRVSLHGADYGEIAAYPKEKSSFCRALHAVEGEYERCRACDRAASEKALSTRDTYIYKCRYGMLEAVSPLYNFGMLTGYLMMGQVMEDGGTATCQGNIPPQLKESLEQVRRVDPGMVESYVRIMTICAQYLTLSNAIPGERVTVAGMAKKFIHDNFTKKLGIKQICDEIGCSKSTLIKCFKNEVGTTVNEYITELRLSEAVAMLNSGKKSIGEIALSCGFSDQSYFSKVFSARFGTPPSEYLPAMTNVEES